MDLLLDTGINHHSMETSHLFINSYLHFDTQVDMACKHLRKFHKVTLLFCHTNNL